MIAGAAVAAIILAHNGFYGLEVAASKILAAPARENLNCGVVIIKYVCVTQRNNIINRFGLISDGPDILGGFDNNLGLRSQSFCSGKVDIFGCSKIFYAYNTSSDVFWRRIVSNYYCVTEGRVLSWSFSHVANARMNTPLPDFTSIPHTKTRNCNVSPKLTLFSTPHLIDGVSKSVVLTNGCNPQSECKQREQGVGHSEIEKGFIHTLMLVSGGVAMLFSAGASSLSYTLRRRGRSALGATIDLASGVALIGSFGWLLLCWTRV